MLQNVQREHQHHQDQRLGKARQIVLEPALADADNVRREESDDAQTGRHRQTGRRHRKALQMSRAGQDAGVVADHDEHEESAEDR